MADAGTRRSGTRTEATADDAVEDVAVGSRIVYAKYGGTEITVDGERFVILDARDVLLVAEEGRAAPGDETASSSGPSGLSTRLVELFSAIDVVRADEATAKRDVLLRAMMTSGVDPLPEATVAQVRRLARQRERLIGQGAYSTGDLRELRGDGSTASTRTWLSRQRSKGALFTVTIDNATFVPTFEVDETGTPRPEIRAVLEALRPAALDGWATWTWFTSSSPWIGGVAPVDLLTTAPERVTRAAERFASNAAA